MINLLENRCIWVQDESLSSKPTQCYSSNFSLSESLATQTDIFRSFNSCGIKYQFSVGLEDGNEEVFKSAPTEMC